MGMMTLIFNLIGFVGLLLFIFSSYLWFSPQPRTSSMAHQLFATESRRAETYLPSDSSWSEGQGLALWKLRGPKQYAIVRKGSQKGFPSLFEFGIGRLSIVKEVATLNQALLLLIEMRETEELAVGKKLDTDEYSTKEPEEIRLELSRARQFEEKNRVSACHIEWAKYEARMNQALQTFEGNHWRPENTRLPAGITIDEAWRVISTSIDDLVNELRRGNRQIDFSETRTLIYGLVGVIQKIETPSETNEAFMWAAIFSLLNDVKTGRLVSSTVLEGFAESGCWDLVYGLSVAWARIEAVQTNQSNFNPLAECALGAMIKWWRITNPTDFNQASMPSELTFQIEAFVNSATTATLPPIFGDRSISRADDFTRHLCQ
jgi:hypothetical protein